MFEPHFDKLRQSQDSVEKLYCPARSLGVQSDDRREEIHRSVKLSKNLTRSIWPQIGVLDNYVQLRFIYRLGGPGELDKRVVQDLTWRDVGCVPHTSDNSPFGIYLFGCFLSLVRLGNGRKSKPGEHFKIDDLFSPVTRPSL